MIWGCQKNIGKLNNGHLGANVENRAREKPSNNALPYGAQAAPPVNADVLALGLEGVRAVPALGGRRAAQGLPAPVL